MIRLGVNVDHVATVRQARRAEHPDPVEAALLAEKAGADGITVHLREDRRHIQERDVERLRFKIRTKINLEMAVTPAMVAFAERLRPAAACFVPEKREELTTEGGLDVVAHEAKVIDAVRTLQSCGVQVSLFIDPVKEQIECAKRTGAHAIEIHTGTFCNANVSARDQERATIVNAAALAANLRLEVHAGHGLDYENVLPIAQISDIVELNIGHSIIARAVMVGIEQAVRDMKELLASVRG
ncbi:MAG TPA: pyridoxine 5'-phosphate synthase [Candidatus Binatia bacterium]|jgi:pyridoxine 5-phosphate synthase|nr:pyridoxine 5'-phosphate synthase [Candidatus Binatia bacterium]